jgi:hypothetical protein
VSTLLSDDISIMKSILSYRAEFIDMIRAALIDDEASSSTSPIAQR